MMTNEEFYEQLETTMAKLDAMNDDELQGFLMYTAVIADVAVRNVAGLPLVGVQDMVVLHYRNVSDRSGLIAELISKVEEDE